MNHRARVAGRMAISLGVVAGVTAAYSFAVHVNPTTIALTYVVVILLIATRWGIAESTSASLGAVLCFNFFFLPPVGTLTIADLQNWVALVAFLLTAIITSQLSGRARRRHMDALTRQRDLERLYVLSRALLLSERGVTMPGHMARHIVDAFGLQTVGVYDQRRLHVRLLVLIDGDVGEHEVCARVIGILFQDALCNGHGLGWILVHQRAPNR